MEIAFEYVSQFIFVMSHCFGKLSVIKSPLFGYEVPVISFIVHIILLNPLFVLAIGMWVFYELNVLLKSIIHINS